MKTSDALESLNNRTAAVVRWDGKIELFGTYEECRKYLKRNLKRVKSNMIDLQYADLLPGNVIKLGILASYVL